MATALGWALKGAILFQINLKKLSEKSKEKTLKDTNTYNFQAISLVRSLKVVMKLCCEMNLLITYTQGKKKSKTYIVFRIFTTLVTYSLHISSSEPSCEVTLSPFPST